MTVSQRAFAPDLKPYMWQYFLHELGHVLGLRHEFAPQEGGAVQLGPRDPFSVMNYRSEPPMITESDIASTRKFYAIPGGNIGNVPLELFVPNN